MSFSKNKRFLAGAICPRCSELDKIVVYSENDDDYRECVSCDYHEKMHIQPLSRELETRVNTSEAQKKAETQVLQFPPLENNKT